MASAFGSSISGPGVNEHAQLGQDLEQIETEGLGFSAIGGESKVRLLPTPWPSDALPPPTSSLLSIASSKGLLAAAGPDAVIVASLDSVRAAFSNTNAGDTSVKAFQPQLTIPLTTRVSHVAFSSDETCLAISAEQGGGIAVYAVDALGQGNQQPTFELPTDGVPLRSLIPNPAPQTAGLFAVVTTNGQLMVADLNQRQFLSGPSGLILKDGVSCVAWSARGKQLVGGMGNGAACQMKPDGQVQAELPLPPGLEGNQHNPCPPFGSNRSPPHHFMCRLRNFTPNLQDLLIISATTSTDVGLVTRSSTPLTSDVPADKITNVFTTTGLANDSRRAQLPMTEDLSDTSVIGADIDLSSKELVDRPIPGEEMDKSLTPLPALMILNDEGILVSWWIVYTESVRQGIAYPGLVNVGTTQQSVQQHNPSQSSPFVPKEQPQQPKPGQPFPASPPQAMKSSTPAFGHASFGTPSSATGSGKQSSVWGTPSTQMQAQSSSTPSATPVFGASTTFGAASVGTAFGSASGLGNRSSPWATASSGSAVNPTSPPTQTGSNVFGAMSTGSGGFGAYTNKGGFGTVASENPSGGLFKQSENNSSFTSGMDTETSFGKPEAEARGTGSDGLFGGSSFKLGTTFKGDGSAKEDGPKPNIDGKELFGSGFSEVLGEASQVSKDSDARETNMETESENEAPVRPDNRPPIHSTTPLNTPAPSNLQFPGLSTGTSNNFSEDSKPKEPVEGQESVPLAAIPDQGGETPSSPKPDEGSSRLSSAPSPTPPSPVIKSEPTENGEDKSSQGVSKEVPEAPLPPDTTSKTTYAVGDSSASSTSTNRFVNEDAPLPPDFVAPKDLGVNESNANTSVPLPAPSGSDSDEGSGEDVAQDLSPISDRSQSLRATPQSSFRDPSNRSPVGELFTHVRRPESKQQISRPLFGEIGNGSVPHFPPPTRVQESPRSPSPVRQNPPVSRLKPENSRSVSAPGGHFQTSTTRKPFSTQSAQPHDHFMRQDAIVEEGKWRAEEDLKKQQEMEAQDLSDREDERVRKEIKSDVEGTLKLESFVAHQDYVGHIDKPGIPGQIEKVYRDINSMIDTLGLNARALKAFVKGHNELDKEGGRTREDLEIADDWCLVEIENLERVEDQLHDQLEEGRVMGVPETLALCQDMQRELTKVRAKYSDIKKVIDAHDDPTHISANKSAPLSSEQAVQQHDLRRVFSEFQSVLTEVEDVVSLLNVKLSSSGGSNSGANRRPTPTVEAVIGTIVKMTSMIEKRSGDVDVLENHMRHLRLGSRGNTTSPGNSPGRLSQPTRGTPTRSSLLGGPGLPSTPRSSRSTPRGLESSSWNASPFSRSANGSASKRSMNGTAAEDMAKRHLASKTRKAQVIDKLRDAIAKKGPRLQTMDD
ncbi:MAG: hypothetical protein M4579_001413 [Chaenotheca gracillima]|nr:MAG: hypothetical protein M4579_001413 [Chaenotheca gracillima]